MQINSGRDEITKFCFYNSQNMKISFIRKKGESNIFIITSSSIYECLHEYFHFKRNPKKLKPPAIEKN